MAGDENKLGVGDRIPDFTLPDQRERPFRLSEHLGRGPLVLYFYPGDDTPGCTREACTFRDRYEDFLEAGAEVIGVSSDSTGSHRDFSSRYSLPFILLSDEKGALRKKLGVPSTLGLLPGRVTYILDREGTVRHIFSSQLNTSKHVAEALRVIGELKGD